MHLRRTLVSRLSLLALGISLTGAAESPATSGVAAATLIVDGGFEERLQRWHAGKGNGIAWDEEFRYSGHASLRVEGKALGSVIVTQYLPLLKPGRRYRLTFAVKTKGIERNTEAPYYRYGTSGAYVNVWAGQGRNLFFPPTALLAGSNRWEVMGYELETGELSGNQRYYIRAGIMDATGTAWFDDLDLVEIALPAER